MSPRRGGESDKIGNRYEGFWTVARLLDVLAGATEWVRLEPLGDLGKGVEFVLKRSDGVVEAHQVKRQFESFNEWNVGKLTALGIWTSAQRHADSDRDYHFVSMVPFRALQELTERVRNSNDYPSFVVGSLPRDLEPLFTHSSNIYGTPENAYRILRRFFVRLIDEVELKRGNAVLSELLLEGGSGRQGAAALGAVVDDSIDVALTADRIVEKLQPDFRRRLSGSRRSLAELVRLETSRWLDSVGGQLFDPAIPRDEAAQLRSIASMAEKVCFLTGAAGGGKTAVLHQAVTDLLSDEIPTLVIRLDRYGTLASTAELGEKLGFSVSPVTALAAGTDDGAAVLVIDQLDAVSVASGRRAENFDVVAGLVSEAAAFPEMRIVLGCRQFDVDNDDRIRNLKSRAEAAVITVAPLTDAQIHTALVSFGVSAVTLRSSQRDVLRLPLHLSLLTTVADEPDTLNFSNSFSLFNAYWEHKRRSVNQRRQGVRFASALGRLAEVISERQELSVPVGVLDAEDLADDADVLVSEQVLVRDGSRIAFVHEAMFDYAFARRWVHRNQSLVDFLTASEQELFRRGQVRQIMAHLRIADPHRFIEEVSNLLVSGDVRFHIKDVVLSVLGGLSDPSSAEAEMLLEATSARPDLGPRTWARIRTSAWFNRLDADGRIVGWLRGNDDEQKRAVNLMAAASCARKCPQSL